LIPLVAGLGCAAAAPRDIPWRNDVAAARIEASGCGRPLLVVSLVGDLRKRC
jgi:hypothetical protein